MEIIKEREKKEIYLKTNEREQEKEERERDITNTGNILNRETNGKKI
jgi:hypothetical protein